MLGYTYEYKKYSYLLQIKTLVIVLSNKLTTTVTNNNDNNNNNHTSIQISQRCQMTMSRSNMI